ncbi:MAG: epoxyqueuosine reductase QueH [Clostridia bacterium]|nr:epoxyqueuosine reductase QueH [Clostridia bacterium]
MENRKNYQKELDRIIEDISMTGKKPRLLLHACCAPCSSYVLEYLSPFFDITILYYNPNISKEEEFQKRYAELSRLIKEMGLEDNVKLLEPVYDPKEFFSRVRGYENCREGGDRCTICYSLRLEAAVRKAAEMKADYFCTTLSISPLKDAVRLNTIGESLGKLYSVKWLPSDFKKKGGYQRSIELSKQYSLYRQDYCGCIYSERERREIY